MRNQSNLFKVTVMLLLLSVGLFFTFLGGHSNADHSDHLPNHRIEIGGQGTPRVPGTKPSETIDGSFFEERLRSIADIGGNGGQLPKPQSPRQEIGNIGGSEKPKTPLPKTNTSTGFRGGDGNLESFRQNGVTAPNPVISNLL